MQKSEAIRRPLEGRLQRGESIHSNKSLLEELSERFSGETWHESAVTALKSQLLARRGLENHKANPYVPSAPVPSTGVVRLVLKVEELAKEAGSFDELATLVASIRRLWVEGREGQSKAT